MDEYIKLSDLMEMFDKSEPLPWYKDAYEMWSKLRSIALKISTVNIDGKRKDGAE